ncbi:MAG TPA: CBS domain-containing protein [Candidatus Saccharimonadales bacterium]|nr:CBS domain-containing protein [Candidatus Saccharimonadales bacterium]
MDVLVLIIDIIVWLLLFAVHGVDLSSSSVSLYELGRRTGDGDKLAEAQLTREKLLPRFRTLQRLLELMLLAIASALTIYLMGWVLGVVVTVLIAMQLDWLSTRTFLTRLINKYYRPRETALLHILSGQKWLDWFSAKQSSGRQSVGSKDELVHLVEQSKGVFSRDEVIGIKSLAAFADKKVSDIMTPRSVIESIAASDNVGPLVIDQLHQTGHSRFPVYDPDIDHIVGMLYLHDLVDLRSNHKTVRQAMQPRVFYIRENHSLEHALHGFLRTRHHLFIVVNEYRETVGLLSLEDVIEALLGRSIVDEFDEYDNLRKVAEGNPKGNNQPKDEVNL